MDERPRKPSWIAVAGLIVACGALALTAIVSLINGASSNGALVTRVGHLEVTAHSIEGKVDNLASEDGKIQLLQMEYGSLSAEVHDHELRLRQARH
jgi:hypothetical protein